MDLQAEHERYLSETVFVHTPVIVTNYPASIKPFYMRHNDDGRTVAAMDILAPRVGELVGGSQREERMEMLEQSLATIGNATGYAPYKDLRRYGSIPHSGFGVGLERLVCGGRWREYSGYIHALVHVCVFMRMCLSALLSLPDFISKFNNAYLLLCQRSYFWSPAWKISERPFLSPAMRAIFSSLRSDGSKGYKVQESLEFALRLGVKFMVLLFMNQSNDFLASDCYFTISHDNM